MLRRGNRNRFVFVTLSKIPDYSFFFRDNLDARVWQHVPDLLDGLGNRGVLRDTLDEDLKFLRRHVFPHEPEEKTRGKTVDSYVGWQALRMLVDR